MTAFAMSLPVSIDILFRSGSGIPAVTSISVFTGPGLILCQQKKIQINFEFFGR